MTDMPPVQFRNLGKSLSAAVAAHDAWVQAIKDRAALAHKSRHEGHEKRQRDAALASTPSDKIRNP